MEQTAATLFNHLREKVGAWFSGAVSVDLAPALLGGLADLMLVRAHLAHC